MGFRAHNATASIASSVGLPTVMMTGSNRAFSRPEMSTYVNMGFTLKVFYFIVRWRIAEKPLLVGNASARTWRKAAMTMLLPLLISQVNDLLTVPEQLPGAFPPSD
jgi:hypothetical protein